MAIKIPEGIPDSTNLLDGIYTFKVESMEPIETSTGKLALKVALRVTKGPNGTTASKGLTHYEQFTIGSNDDPQAREGNTWLSSFGAISLKKAQETMGRDIFWQLPNDYKTMVEVRNNGVPLIEQAPRAGITQALCALIENLTGESQKPAAESTAGGAAAASSRWLSFMSGKGKNK